MSLLKKKFPPGWAAGEKKPPFPSRRMNFRSGLRRLLSDPRRLWSLTSSRASWVGGAVLNHLLLPRRKLLLRKKIWAGFITWKLLQNKQGTFRPQRRKQIGQQILKRRLCHHNPPLRVWETI